MPVNFTEVKQKIIKPGLGITPPEVEAKDEIIEQRGERSKVWNLGGDKRRCIVGMKALHYRDNPLDTNEQFKEIDLTLLPDKSCHKTQYDIQVYDNKVGFSYTTKRGGRLDFELLEIGGVAVDNGRFNIVQDGNQLYWNNVADDIDIKIMLRPQSAELYKQLKTATAAKTFKWRVQRWKDSKCDFSRELSGIDSTIKAGHLEINAITTLESKEVDRDIYIFEEEWTGRLSRIVDLETRIKEWKTDPIYPVIIDAVANEEVTANTDDGIEKFNASITNNADLIVCKSDQTKNGWMRFASVNLPQGANITAATLGMSLKYCTGPNTVDVYFENMDNATQPFTAADRPSQMATGVKIPAGGIAWTPGSSAALDTVGVTNAIQTLVDRTGWASGQGMRCAVMNGLGNLYWYAADHATKPPTQLDITYTVGGGGSPGAILLMDHFNGGFLNG